MKPEAKIERGVSMWAGDHGWLVIKFSPMGNVGWPDRVFIKDGRHIWIEFKAPGEKPRKIQDYRHAQLRRHGAEVYVIDNAVEGVALLTRLGETDGVYTP